ncbi:ribonuclease P [Theileria orientalis]|uniref:Ribonuclease P n=1 Tax=Theileria orientalis TaxID=68886 RepID=A0A976QSS9_THEOR|nr:ribonuclease P [Theileria orientalis]
MIDLSFLWPGIKDAHNVVEAATNIGWSSIGFNLYYKADGRGVHQIDFKPEISQHIVDSRTKFIPPSLNTQISPVISDSSGETGLSLGNNFFRRISVLLLDDFNPNSLLKFADSNYFEIFSVIPTNARSFQSACESINCDLINLNHYCYYSSYKLKRGFINAALQRGCFFEVTLTHKMLDFEFKEGAKDSINISFQKNLPSVIKHIPLKRLVLSTGARETREIVDPNLLLGTCTELFSGFSGKKLDLVCCLTKAPNECLKKGSARRTYGTGIMSHTIEGDFGKIFK